MSSITPAQEKFIYSLMAEIGGYSTSEWDAVEDLTKAQASEQISELLDIKRNLEAALPAGDRLSTPKQRNYINALGKKKGIRSVNHVIVIDGTSVAIFDFDTLTMSMASRVIDTLKAL